MTYPEQETMEQSFNKIGFVLAHKRLDADDADVEGDFFYLLLPAELA